MMKSFPSCASWGVGIALAFARGGPSREDAWGIPPPVAPYGLDPLPSERVVLPIIFPVLGQSRWKDGYGDLRGDFLHTGIDVRAAKMTPIVAPIDGILGMKRESFWIRGDDGWQILGTHLNDDNPGTHDHNATSDYMFAPDVAPGIRVYAGQFLGYVGESGDATAPHLHFEIYAPGPGRIQDRIRNPYPSLKAAQIISAPRVRLYRPELRPNPHEVRLDGCIRKLEPTRGRITLLLTSKADATGNVAATPFVRYLHLHLDPSTVGDAGGWDTLRQIGQHLPVGVFLDAGSAPDNQTVRRLVLPPIPPKPQPIVKRHRSSRGSPPALPSLPPPLPPAKPLPTLGPDETIADFESGTWDGWTLTGDGWGPTPTSSNTFSGRITGMQGQFFLCTFLPPLGNAARVRALSKPFTIHRSYLDLWVGGGNFPEEACVNLLVDGRVAATATGDGGPWLRPVRWDVRGLSGQSAQIEVVDRSTSSARGYIMVDQIVLTDAPRPPVR